MKSALFALGLSALLLGTSVQAQEQKVGTNGCFAGRITCAQWCHKYREPQNQESCLRTHPRSCMKRYGSLKFCVGDKAN